MNLSIHTKKSRHRQPVGDPSRIVTTVSQTIPRKNSNIVDLLRTAPSALSLEKRVELLCLSKSLEKKVLSKVHNPERSSLISVEEEKELASEVLLRRHSFTRLIFENRFFRQAALTIIQNIYLFQRRRIFFGTTHTTAEQERQEALLLFSDSPAKTTVPLAKTFQHLILARVWDRIISTASNSFLDSPPFQQLHDMVEELNTLRNIYILLSTGLIRKITHSVSPVYQQSITKDDALQIGSFGIARAAYRYHPSLGLRFSTYAARWIQKEIQRQSLEGRLIRISSNLVEQLSRSLRQGNPKEQQQLYELLGKATALFNGKDTGGAVDLAQSGLPSPHLTVEQKDTAEIIAHAIDTLSPKSRDVILRRYGMGPYSKREQSVIEISREYGVTRGSIYQLEKVALIKLRKILAKQLR